MLHQSGRFAQAQAIYEEILRKEPKHFDALHLLGVIAVQTRNPGRGVDLISRALEIDSTNAHAHFNRGLALQELGQLEAALASYDRAITMHGGFAEAYSNRGLVLKELGQLRAALASYDRAI